jgi:DNA-binding HxlR family transcriptional regulator
VVAVTTVRAWSTSEVCLTWRPVFPPRVEYTLTEAGLVLRETVNVLCTWTRSHVGVISEARRRFDAAL